MATSNPTYPRALVDDSALTTSDIDRALRRMKSGLRLVDLKRKLLAPDVDACYALSLSEEIVTLQTAA